MGRPATPVLTRIFKLTVINEAPATALELEKYVGDDAPVIPDDIREVPWKWIGALDTRGYPTGKMGSPRVILYATFRGAIRPGLHLDLEDKLDINPFRARFIPHGLRQIVYPFKPIHFVTEEQLPEEAPSDRDAHLKDLAEVIEDYYARQPFKTWAGYVATLRQEFFDVSIQDQHDALMQSGIGKMLTGEPEYVQPNPQQEP